MRCWWLWNNYKAFHLAKLAEGCELNLISDLRLRRAVFVKEILAPPSPPSSPSDGLMRPYLSLITILPTQGRSRAGQQNCVHINTEQQRLVNNCGPATSSAARGFKERLGQGWGGGGPSLRNYNEDITAQGAKPIHDTLFNKSTCSCWTMHCKHTSS